jgi:branched-chain amino acid transport system substrate-binding protein
MTMKSLLSTVSLALLIGSAATAAQAQIAIGHLADYSGGTSDVGTPYGQGVADTFAWVNKNGGVGGKQLAVDTNDYGYQVPRAIALYKKWSGGDKVAAIMGWGTADTEALTGFLAQDKIPDISGSYAAALTDPELLGRAARRADLGGRGLESQGQARQAEIRAYGGQPSLSERSKGGGRSDCHRTRLRGVAAAGIRIGTR